MGDISREDNILYAKMAEQAERYEDMVEFMDNVVRTGETLTPDERNLLSVAYKNVVGARRSSYRVVSSHVTNSGEGIKKEVAEEFTKKIREELEKRCRDVLDLLDNFLIKDIGDGEGKQETGVEQAVFYLKMKGDYFRYLVEVEEEKDKKEIIEKSSEAYKKASKIAEELPSTNPIRLGLALNFSVFYYEIESSPEKACKLAKDAFDAAISELDNLKEESYKDSTLIMQLLRDNLTLWAAETSGNDDEANN
jgi:hypothetical protein